jgi:hypothetical protein
MSRGLSVGCAREVKQTKQAMIQQATARNLKGMGLVTSLKLGIQHL